MDLRRFGVGHRRPDGPPGTRGVEGQQIHVDARGVIAEMALRPRAVVPPHTNPNLIYFVVVEGGGFVRVGDETARISAGAAIEPFVVPAPADGALAPKPPIDPAGHRSSESEPW